MASRDTVPRDQRVAIVRAAPSLLSASATGARDVLRSWGLCRCSLCQSPARRNATYYPSARPRFFRGSLDTVATQPARPRDRLSSNLAVDLSPLRRRVSYVAIGRQPSVSWVRTPLSLFLFIFFFSFSLSSSFAECRVCRRIGERCRLKESEFSDASRVRIAARMFRGSPCRSSDRGSFFPAPNAANPEMINPRVALSETAEAIAAVPLLPLFSFDSTHRAGCLCPQKLHVNRPLARTEIHG